VSEAYRNSPQKEERADARVQHLWALYEVGQAISASMELDQFMALVVEKACHLLGVEQCGLFLVETRTEEGPALRCRQARGLPEAYSQRVRLGPRESMAGRVIADARTMWTGDLLADPRFSLTEETRALMAEHGIHGTLAAPVMAGGRALGVIAVYRSAGVGFLPEEADLLSAFALQVGIAMENARLLAESQESLGHARALFEVSKAVAGSLETERALHLIVQKAVELTGVRHCLLWLREDGPPGEGGVRPRAQAGFDLSVVERLLLRPGEGLVGRVLRERRPAWTSDILGDPDVPVSAEWAATIRRLDIGAMLGVPVEYGEVFAGVLTVYRPRGSAFTPDEATLLWSFGAMAAIALENARLVAERTKAQVEAMRAMARAAADRILNPLNIMVGNAQLLALDLAPDHPGHQRIERILESGQRIVGVVAQMNRVGRYRTHEFSPGLFELALDDATEADPANPLPPPSAPK